MISKQIKKLMSSRLFFKIAFVVLVLFSALATTQVTVAAEITQGNILNLINAERSARKLPKLKLDPDLNHAAEMKSHDMINRHYFDHFAFGLTPWLFMANAGYGDYLYAGENLAMDFKPSEAEKMTRKWMNSFSHRDNIINPEFNDIGIGIVKGIYQENGSSRETIMVTTMFGRRKPLIYRAIDNFKTMFPLY